MYGPLYYATHAWNILKPLDGGLECTDPDHSLFQYCRRTYIDPMLTAFQRIHVTLERLRKGRKVACIVFGVDSAIDSKP